MSTVNHFREGLSEAWDHLVEGWRRLSRRAAGAVTRFTPGTKAREQEPGAGRELVQRSAGGGVLAAEVFDDEDKIVVRLEVPGLARSDFDLEVLDDYLVVRGEKRVERERKEGRYHVTECAYGRFERTIPLPARVDTGKAEASYKAGVLRVVLPKAAGARRRKVTVEVH